MNRNKSADSALGMDQAITRRDFINGMAVAAAAALPMAGALAQSDPSNSTTSGPAAQDALGYYPPSLTGLRGSHPGSFEDAHALRDGTTGPAPIDTGETYDLIIVGAGISGLSAAHFHRARTSPRARILILDNHDDFGGHAKRNEYHLNGGLHLMNGGTLESTVPDPTARSRRDCCAPSASTWRSSRTPLSIQNSTSNAACAQACSSIRKPSVPTSSS
jgi:spermidine dehydrogenase